MNLVAKVVDWNNKVVSELNLKEDVFGEDYRADLIHQVIRWQQNKARRATQHVKNRSEVSGAHRKIHPQKESGKARQGDGKAPHFRGGGVAFGIFGRNYVIKLNKKMKSFALRSTLSYKFSNGGLVLVDDLSKVSWSKTKECSERLLKLVGNQKVLIITEALKEMEGIKNLPNVRIIHPDGVNVLSCCPRLLLSDQNSIAKLESRLSK